jgi:transcriptional regulator with XRE-family HTH domain
MISVLGEKEAMQTLGARIRAQRLRRNLSQGHMASVLGVSEPTYRKIEAGDGSVEFRNVAKTLAVLGFDQALAELIPEVAPEIRMADLLAPQRKKASRRQK